MQPDLAFYDAQMDGFDLALQTGDIDAETYKAIGDELRRELREALGITEERA